MVVCNGSIDDSARAIGQLKLHQAIAKDPTDFGFSSLTSNN